MYDLIMFFIERSGGNLKPIQTRDPKVLKLPDNLYEHRFAQCKYAQMFLCMFATGFVLFCFA